MGRPRINIVKVCIICGSSFDPRRPSGRIDSSAKVCSLSCRGVAGGRSGLGRPTPQKVRDKIRNAQLGDKGNNWQGGTWSSQPQSERKSARYRTIRRSVLERDNYSCVLCGESGYLEVDHIKSYSKYPELRFELSNLRTLCRPCHLETESFARG